MLTRLSALTELISNGALSSRFWLYGQSPNTARRQRARRFAAVVIVIGRRDGRREQSRCGRERRDGLAGSSRRVPGRGTEARDARNALLRFRDRGDAWQESFSAAIDSARQRRLTASFSRRWMPQTHPSRYGGGCAAPAYGTTIFVGSHSRLPSRLWRQLNVPTRRSSSSLSFTFTPLNVSSSVWAAARFGGCGSERDDSLLLLSFQHELTQVERGAGLRADEDRSIGKRRGGRLHPASPLAMYPAHTPQEPLPRRQVDREVHVSDERWVATGQVLREGLAAS